MSNPIDTFISAFKSHDRELFLSCFTPDGAIEDDDQTLSGAPLEAFFTHGIVARNAFLKVVDRQSSDNEEVMHVLMDGEFVKDYGIHEPFDLWFRFRLEGFRIKVMKMSDIDPEKPTMLAAYAAFSNLSSPLEVLRVGPRNVPEPREGWVRVRLHAVGINYHDIFTLRGIGMQELRFPLILGNEGAGVLDDGTEVAIYPTITSSAPYGDETLDPERSVIGEAEPGTMAECVLVPERNAVPRPEGISAQSAAVLGIAWLTAYRMLFVKSGMQEGGLMLVQGSSGGVASALIQMGAAAGMRVWATARSEEKRSFGLQLGAEQVFEPGATLPSKVDAVFDTSGATTFKHSLESVRAGGTVVSCGLHSGEDKYVKLNLMRLFTEQIHLTGVYTGTLQEFKDMMAFLAEKKVVPHIGMVFPLSKAKEAFEMFMSGDKFGKVVVEM
ncbi:hypothetical protein LTR09_009726 [Extremus antarcticus]|uniref:Enoyl reductase (ER) domain-containing protein n=1 Tax=Extremus antarcticus TaxID=702011 RepID=A0AAJ0D8I4_9PEZI|nr:hypothetical protein LTR09_009726 [Extremus antarcticus]